MTEQEKIKKLAKDLCLVKESCNDVCDPEECCAAYKHAKKAVSGTCCINGCNLIRRNEAVRVS